MTFKIQVQMDTSGVAQAAQGVVEDLGKTSTAADKATTAMNGVGTAATDGMGKTMTAAQQARQAVEGMAAGLERTKAYAEAYRKAMDEQWAAINAKKFDDENLKRMNAPMIEFADGVASLNRLFDSAKISASQYDSELAKLTGDLERAGGHSLSDELKQQEAMLEKIQGPARAYQANIAALNALLDRGAISTAQYDAELVKLDAKFGSSKAAGLSPELQREADILERLRKPMADYEQHLTTITTLLAKGTISQTEFDRELERAQKAAAVGLGPVQGPKQQTTTDVPAAGGGGRASELGNFGQALAQPFGSVGYALGGLASTGTIAAATLAVVALGAEVINLGDQYTTLENKIAKFTYSGETANHILEQQLSLSKELHGDLSTTIDVYSSIREGTDELNLSRRKQLDLTREIGDAVVASGKDLASAEGLAKRLSFAFASGTVQPRELRSIFREFPAIADGFEKSLGKSRLELLRLAGAGQLTASQMIHVFDQMGPELASRVSAMGQTTTQAWQHIKDTVTVAMGDSGSATNWVEAGLGAGGPSAKEIADKQAEDEARRHALIMKEIGKQLAAEQERTARTAQIADAAKSRGISIGPFDKSAADSIDRARITARAAGVELADAFEGAKERASLLGIAIDKMNDSHAMERMADEAKRVYDALHGADDIIYKNTQHWTEIADRIDTARKAIEKYNAAGQSGSREVLELQRQIGQDDIALRLKDYGPTTTAAIQAIDKAKGELSDLSKATQEGMRHGEEARQAYDRLLTTLNDGRLPEARRIWEEFNLPIQQSQRDIAATEVLFKRGAITLGQYNVEMKKLTDSALGAAGAYELLIETQEHQDWRLLGYRTREDGQRVPTERQSHLEEQGQMARDTRQDSLVESAVEPARIYEQALRDIDEATRRWGLSNQVAVTLQLKARDAFDSASVSVDALSKRTTKYEAALQELAAQRDAHRSDGDSLDRGNDEGFQRQLLDLDRAAKLVESYDVPLINYKQRLETISVAVAKLGLTHELAAEQMRMARHEYNAAEEALHNVRGPLEQYALTLRHLDDQLHNSEISQSKYTEAVAQAKVTLYTATGQDKTFLGGLELEWIKLTQQAEAFGATVANVLVSDVDKLNESIVSAANGGAVSWTAMVDSMIQDLEKLILKQLEVQAVSALFGAAGGLASAIGGAAAGSAASDIGTIAVESAGSYRTGGAFMVGGNGGTDTTPIAFHATRGEVVSITPPGAYQHPSQAAMSYAGTPAPQPPPVINVHNHYDSSVGIAAIQSPGGTTAVLNILRANAGAFRSALGVKG